jgi:predicted transcriptional regulator
MNNLAKVNPEHLPTPAQLRTLRMVHKLLTKTGKFPTQRELAAALGLSENGANSHIRALVDRGFLTEPEIVRVQHITAAGLKWVKP